MNSSKTIVLLIAFLLALFLWYETTPGSDARKRAKEKSDERERNPVH